MVVGFVVGFVVVVLGVAGLLVDGLALVVGFAVDGLVLGAFEVVAGAGAVVLGAAEVGAAVGAALVGSALVGADSEGAAEDGGADIGASAATLVFGSPLSDEPELHAEAANTTATAAAARVMRFFFKSVQPFCFLRDLAGLLMPD